MSETIQPQAAEKFSNAFSIATTHARVYIEPDDDYCKTYGIKKEQRVLDTTGMLRLETGEEVVFLSPAEALSIAAALQAVSVHLLETTEREVAKGASRPTSRTLSKMVSISTSSNLRSTRHRISSSTNVTTGPGN